MRSFWKIILLSGTAKRLWFPGHDNLRSRATPRPPHPTPPPPALPHLPPPYSTLPPVSTCRHTHTHTRRHTHIITRTRWPVLLRRREMLSNSAFQHSTSDYLFSFTGRFELVMYFPFSASLTLSLSHTLWEFLVPRCTRSARTKT